MRTKLLCISFFAFTFLSLAQVGIDTENPQETLHVAGTVRIDDTTTYSNAANTVSAFDEDGNISKVSVGDNLDLSNGVLSAANTKITYQTITLTNGTVNSFNNQFDLNGANSDKVVFILTCAQGNNCNNPTLNSIPGGTDGRRLTLMGDANFNLVIQTVGNVTSGNANSIYLRGSGGLNLSQESFIELFYDGSINRWRVLAYRT